MKDVFIYIYECLLLEVFLHIQTRYAFYIQRNTLECYVNT